MVRIDPAVLEAFATDLTIGLGAPEASARAVAASLVDADRRGHDSHGVLRLPLYADQIRAEAIDPIASPTIVHESPITALIDGQYSFGQVVGREAVDVLAEKAKDHGAAVVGMRNATHLGRLGEWAERTTGHGLLFVGYISGSVYTVAPAGSHERRLSTNPLAMGVPTFDALPFPIVLDIATSQVAHGKIRKLALAEEPIPADWTITESGEPITDADAFAQGEGAILPLGGTHSGYKGTGLAVMVELFSSTLGDAEIAGQPDAAAGGNDAVFIAIDPLEFTTQSAHIARVTAFADYLKTAEYPDTIPAGIAAYAGAGLLPGEPEHELYTATRDAVDLEARIAAELCVLAREHDLDEAIPAAFQDLTE